MVAHQHFQRLKRMYASGSSEPTGEQVAISYGRAELEGTIDAVRSTAVGAEMPHHRLLSDAAALAAGSLEKERFVTAERFSVDIVRSDYEGPVVTSAEVVLAEPPRYVVQAVMVDDEGGLVAEGKGVFRPGDDHLPPASAAEQAEAPAGPHDTLRPRLSQLACEKIGSSLRDDRSSVNSRSPLPLWSGGPCI
jgi:hypothetical protein